MNKIHNWLESLPEWKRPIVGVVMMVLIIALCPIWITLCMGYLGYEMVRNLVAPAVTYRRPVPPPAPPRKA